MCKWLVESLEDSHLQDFAYNMKSKNPRNVAHHSMARANLKKSKKVLTFTTTASKCMPKRPRICINWNLPFQTQIYLVKVPLNVNIVKQDLLHKKQFLKNLWSDVWKGGFQLMQILGVLGMYFDAVVVEVEKP